MPTTELLKAKLKSREKVEKYTGVITGDLIKHEEKWKLHTQKNKKKHNIGIVNGDSGSYSFRKKRHKVAKYGLL